MLVHMINQKHVDWYTGSRAAEDLWSGTIMESGLVARTQKQTGDRQLCFNTLTQNMDGFESQGGNIQRGVVGVSWQVWLAEEWSWNCLETMWCKAKWAD